MTQEDTQIWYHRLRDRPPMTHEVTIRSSEVSCACGWRRTTITGASSARYGYAHADQNKPSIVNDHRFNDSFDHHEVTITPTGWSCICGEGHVTVVGDEMARGAYAHSRANNIAPVEDKRSDVHAGY